MGLYYNSSIMFKRRKEEEPQPQTPIFYGWGESATGNFGDDELLRLRDEHPSEIAQALWNPGRFVQTQALYELLAHGNPRKAAMVARNLVEQHPICENSLREDVGDEITDYLLKSQLLNLPSKPEEYPR